jgi:hypothetical protein
MAEAERRTEYDHTHGRPTEMPLETLKEERALKFLA